MSTLQVQGSVVLLIQTSAASFLVSTKPPLWNQTCHNRCVQLVAGYRHSLFTRTKYMTPIFDWHYNNNMDELSMVTLGSYMSGARQGTRRDTWGAKHQLLVNRAFTGPEEPRVIPGSWRAWSCIRSTALWEPSYETQWGYGRPTWRSSSGPLHKSPSSAV